MHGEGRRTYISIQNLAPAGGAPDAEFRLRIFTTRDEEVLTTVRVAGDRCVFLDLADHLPPGWEGRTGVVWIEHTDINVGAHWFVTDEARDAFAADHFTGG